MSPQRQGAPHRPAMCLYLLQLVPCGQASKWKHDRVTGTLALSSARTGNAVGLCLDSSTLSEQCGWGRQCVAGLWECTAGFAAQNWTYGAADHTFQNTRDAGFVGTQGGADSGGTHMLKVESTSLFPIIVSPSSHDNRSQWVFEADGTISWAFNSSQCLGMVPPPTVVGIDQYMVGDGMMAAPVLVAGARERDVYFPRGATWTHHFTGKVYRGGTTASVPAPLDHFPLFLRGNL